MIKQSCFACIMALVLAGCTRNGAGSKMSVSISAASLMHQRDSAMTSTPPLKTVIVNIRPVGGGTPQVIHRDFESSATTYDLDFDFQNVPTGDIIVQALAVYASSGGGMQIKYGDSTINFPTEVTATISPSATSITKQTYLAGRVQMPGGSYPTGTLVALFTPPGGKPQMVVDSKPIVAGWFNVFAVNGTGAAFDYVVQETQQTIFSGLNSDLTTDKTGAACTASSLTGGCPLVLVSQDRLKVKKPASFSRNGDFSNPAIQSNAPTDYVLGFFGALAGGTRSVCYANDIYEAIPRVFADATLSTPLEVKFTSGTAAQVTVSGGGNSTFTSGVLYDNAAASICDYPQLTNGSALILNHTLLGDNDENFGGFNSPWMMIQPFSKSGNQYLSVVTNPTYGTTATYNAGATTATLNSAFAPLAGASITGTGLSAIITAVTKVSAGVWTIALDTAATSSENQIAVTLQQPYAQLQWALLPGIAFTYSSLSLSTSATSISVPTISEPIVKGLYVRDQTTPNAILNGVATVASVTGTSPSVVTLDATPAVAGTDTLSFSYLSGVEVWGRPVYNGQAATNGTTDITITPAMATSDLIGQPISGTNIPAGATVASIIDLSHIRMSVAATGSSTSGNVMIGTSSTSGENDCSKIASQGFIYLDTVDPAIPKYSYSGRPHLPVGMNVNYQFALCAATSTGTTKTYLGSYVTGQPSWWGDDNRWPFGWANSTQTNSSVTDPYANLNIVSSRIVSVTFPAPGLTNLNLSSPIGATANDEVMINILAQNSNADCGLGYAGVGGYVFARVINGVASVITIPSGTAVDQLSLAQLGATLASGSSFCYAQATRVAQYRNLSISSLFSGSTNGTSLNLLGSEAIVPIRVNGSMTISANMDLSGTGYAGGYVATNDNGASERGPASATAPGGGRGGKVGTSAGGGGAGIGDGGDASGSTGTGGQGGANSGNGEGLLVSLGGGAAAYGSFNAGAGGGFLMIAAYNLAFPTEITISENGQTGGTSGTAGGAGGGSINILAGSVTGSSAGVSLSASGAAGELSGGGGGGGGYVSALACSSTIALNPVISGGVAGTGGTSGSSGSSQINYMDALSSKRWCY